MNTKEAINTLIDKGNQELELEVFFIQEGKKDEPYSIALIKPDKKPIEMTDGGYYYYSEHGCIIESYTRLELGSKIKINIKYFRITKAGNALIPTKEVNNNTHKYKP